MDANSISCSSEQPGTEKLQDAASETSALSNTEKSGGASENMVVNSDSQLLESKHSSVLTDNGDPYISPVISSSCVPKDSNSQVEHSVDELSESRENESRVRGDSSAASSSHEPLNDSMLRDDSVVEFSLNSDYSQENKDVLETDMKQTEDNADCGKQSSCSSPSTEEELDPPTVVREGVEQCPGDLVGGGTVAALGEAPAENQRTSSNLQNEIEAILSTTPVIGSPNSDSEVSKADLSSKSKDNLMSMLSDLLDECDWLKKEKVRLEREVDRVEANHSSETYNSQIEALEKSLAQAQVDSCSWEQKLQLAEQNYMTENVKVRTDLTSRLERVTKQYEAANKDKEAMVIKYATSEREVIVAKKQKDAIEKKMKEMEREREHLINKNKRLISENARICQILDTKVQKNNAFQREVDRLKEEVNSRDIKIKWSQTKLKSEMDGHQECQAKLDRALTKITKHEEELRAIKEEADNIVRAAKSDENARANILDMQLKEEKARLIMERQVNEDRGSVFNKLMTDFEELRLKHQTLEEEATSLRAVAASRELEREEMEKLFTSLRAEVTSAHKEASDLSLQLSDSAYLQQQLKREKDQLEHASQEVDKLQSTNNELESDLLACRQKEAELLAFTEKLADKNVQIQSQLSALQSKTQLMEIEHDELKSEVDDLKMLKAKLKAEITKENQKHKAKAESLSQQLAEKTEEAKHLSTRSLDLENEIQVLNRKHNNALKDITREMHKLRRRLDLQENSSSGGNESASGGVSSGRSSQSATPHDSLSQGSRASSNTSLNTLEYHNGIAPHSQDPLSHLNDPLVTQQLLVDRIIKLQKTAAKRAEKMEFLEEHNTQLVAELKKKSRIIHHYIMREEAGALANSASDLSKAELMRHGGIMASVYGSAPRDGTMTLELSLEINRKLQAVLEDTLLKNITLKDNLNTLGDEIAKISQQKQQLTSQK